MISLMQLGLLVALTFAAPPAASTTPIPPSQDPFYTTPTGFETALPGTVLRIRVAPGNVTLLYEPSSAAYNVLFRTTDSNYRPSWAVTTLFVPTNGSGNALMSYQIPYNSVDLDAAPSYELYSASSFTALQVDDISNSLKQGWHVSVPDHEGPLGSFGLGLQEGHVVLDSLRAVTSLSLGLKEDARIALWGYSGGSIASEWAAELQAQYAPELNIVGTAIGGLPVNATEVLTSVNGTQFAGLFPQVLLGVTSQNEQARQLLLSQLQPTGPYNSSYFLSALNQSIVESFVTFNNTQSWNFLKDGTAFLQQPIIKNIIDNESLMGFHGIPQMPMFIYKAIADELAPIADTDALVARYCSVGVDIEYRRNSVGGHLAEYTNGDIPAFEWLQGVLNAKGATPISTGACNVQNVAINVTDSPF